MLRTRAPYGPLVLLCDRGCCDALPVKSFTFDGVRGELEQGGWVLTEVTVDGRARWAVTCRSCKVHVST